MVLINAFRRDLELILSTENTAPLQLMDIGVRIALFCALGWCDRLGFAKVSHEFGSGDYRAEVGGGVLDMSTERL